MRPARVLLLAAALAGQTAAADPLTLDDAVRSALAHHPRLAAADAQARAAGASAKAAEAARYPSLDARIALRRTDNPLDAFADRILTRSVDPATGFTSDNLNNPDASTLFNTGVSLSVPVYKGGRPTAAIAAASAQADAAVHSYARTHEEVTFDATCAYLEAQAAEEGVRIGEDALESAKRHARTAAALARERRTVESDRLAAEVNAALIEGRLAQARSAAAQARAALVQAAALAPGIDGELDRWRDASPGADVPDLQTLEARALENRRDLAAARAEQTASRKRIDEARAGLRPQLDLIASQNWYDDNVGFDSSAWSVAGVVSANLWSGGRTRAETAAARAGAEVAADRVQGLEDVIRAEVRSAHAQVLEAAARVRLCADNEGKSRRTVDLVRARYGEGRTILLDLLQAERVLVETRQERLAASLALRTAQARLSLASGTMRPDL